MVVTAVAEKEELEETVAREAGHGGPATMEGAGAAAAKEVVVTDMAGQGAGLMEAVASQEAGAKAEEQQEVVGMVEGYLVAVVMAGAETAEATAGATEAGAETAAAAKAEEPEVEIGRASCRERV